MKATVSGEAFGACLAALLACAGAAQAAKTGVLPVRAVNLEEGAAEAIRAVMVGQYAKASGATVVTIQAAAESQGQQVDEILEPTAVGLGSSAFTGGIVISVVRRDALGNELHRADATANGLAEIEEVTERLAHALVQRTSVGETRDLQNVLAIETRKRKRPLLETLWGFRSSLSAALSSQGSFRPVAQLGLNWRLEDERYFLEVGADMLLPAGRDGSKVAYGGVGVELGASYYLSHGNFAPYVGGGVLPRLLFGGSEVSPVNAAVYAQAGVMFPRNYSSRLYVETRIAQSLLPVDRSAYPTEIGLAMGVGW